MLKGIRETLLNIEHNICVIKFEEMSTRNKVFEGIPQLPSVTEAEYMQWKRELLVFSSCYRSF